MAPGTWTPTKRRGPIAAEFQTPGPAAINLSTTFGSTPANKSRSPAFTMTARNELKPLTAGPGPGQYNVNGLSYKGKDDPQAPSMHTKLKDAKQFVTPSPGDYCPEKAYTTLEPSHKFSFGIKAQHGKQPDIPAPNSYTIPDLIGSVKGGTHNSPPCFTMGGRFVPAEDKMKVPGPGSYNETQIENYKTDKSPAFSMGQRTVIPSDHTLKPGPGAHCPEKCSQSNSPKLTMSPRLEEINKNNVPGPGAYEAVDVNKCREKQPIYTMSPKTELPTDKTNKPAPNHYSPEKCSQSNGPKFTMSPRLEEINKNKVPGPGSYEEVDVNKCREKQPSYTMSPKTELPTDKTNKPAPNHYSPEKCSQSNGPKFTMSPRLEEINKNKVPGPGSYEAVDVDKCREKQPVFTMSPKTEMPVDKTLKPAPNVYYPEKCMTDAGPKFTLSPRLEEPNKNIVPGPGTYECIQVDKLREKQPIYTMSPKTQLPEDKCPKPAPNAYHPEEAEVTMKHTPKFSFGVKHSQYLGKLRDQ